MNDNFHSFYTKIGFDFREDYWCSSDMDGSAHEPGCCQPLDKSAPFFRNDFFYMQLEKALGKSRCLEVTFRTLI